MVLITATIGNSSHLHFSMLKSLPSLAKFFATLLLPFITKLLDKVAKGINR